MADATDNPTDTYQRSRGRKLLEELTTPTPARMTRAELARICGVTPAAVGEWIRGESRPDFENMAKLAKILDQPLDVFAQDV